MEIIYKTITNAVVFGLLMSPMVMSLIFTYKTLNIIDVSLQASIAWGGITSAFLISIGVPWYVSFIGAILSGCLIGCFMGITHVYLKINDILSGILISFSGYSIAVLIVGEKISLLNHTTLFSTIRDRNIQIAIILIIVILVKMLIDWFLSTEKGLIMRAVGTNEQAVWNVSPSIYRFWGIIMSNGIVALSGAMLAQYEGSGRSSRGNDMIIDALTGYVVGFSLISLFPKAIKYIFMSASVGKQFIHKIILAIKPTSIAITGCLIYYIVYYLVVLYSPHEELPKLMLSIVLIGLLGNKSAIYGAVKSYVYKKAKYVDR